jgi:chaperonin GroES
METIGQFEFQPLYDRLLVERVEATIQTPGGLYIPESGKEKPCQGYVIAAGTGRIREDGTVTPLIVRTGQKVLFGKYAGTDIKLNEKEYLIMREEDVLGIIR